MLKSLFAMPFMMAIYAISIGTLYFLLRDFSFSWLAVAIGVIPFTFFFTRLRVKKHKARTDPNLKTFLMLAFFGSLWTMLDMLSKRNFSAVPVSFALVFLILFLLFVFWFSRFDRPDNKDVLDIGKLFPSIELENEKSEKVNTDDLLKLPCLFMFYRGNWCPLCMAQVKEIAGLYQELDQRGINTVLISPQGFENTQELAKKHKVPFTYLLDSEFKLAKKLKIFHKNGVPKGMMGYKEDTVFPTVILTDEKGNVIYIDQTDNYLVRPEPKTFLKIFDDHKVNHILEKKVQERTEAVKELLDNTGEGFFTFGEDYSIHREYSIACNIFFGKQIKYLDPLTLIFGTKRESIKEVMDLLFDGTGSFDLLEGILPQEIVVNDKILTIKYRWLPSSDPTIANKVMVILNDVTQKRALEAQLNYRISESAISTMKDVLLNTVSKEKIQEAIEDMLKQPIGIVFKKYETAAKNLAEQLHKKIEVKLEGTDIRVSYDHLDPIFSTLVHLIRNSVDHGIEDPETRIMLGKPESGYLTIHSTKKDKTLSILIRDDGAGIDTEVVKKIALKRQIIDEAYANQASEEELINLIFAPGFSTKESVSDISGRGVGMDAVKTAVNEMNGEISINSKLDQGTTFVLQIPNT